VRDGTPLPQGWLHMPGLVVDRTNIDAIIQRQTSPEAAYAYYKPEIDRILGDPQAVLQPLAEAR
jgi:hypothetical protein